MITFDEALRVPPSEIRRVEWLCAKLMGLHAERPDLNRSDVVRALTHERKRTGGA